MWEITYGSGTLELQPFNMETLRCHKDAPRTANLLALI